MYPLGVHVVDAFEELIGMVTLTSVLAPSASPVFAPNKFCARQFVYLVLDFTIVVSYVMYWECCAFAGVI
ncbi:hypothetical protein K440DRAFT_634971 [Wilcoxina mikolae CBS 423.85]|nr:hypothetical protein K440DRAFT_634971 [Wilcoxina mikolae CBS 423.85]